MIKHVGFVFNACSLIIISVYLSFAIAQSSVDPTNNLTGSIQIHDPSSVIKCGNTYYVYQTGGGSKSSPDRKNWTDGASIISGANAVGTQSWWTTHGGEIWAPEVAYMDGVYYCFYSVSVWMGFNSAVGVATNVTLDQSSSSYKWVDKGIVMDSLQAADGGPMVNVIDPSTFLDDDGKWYLAFGSYQGGVRLAEISRTTGKPVNNPAHPIKITGSLGEASFIFHWKNYYYYTVSRGTCCSGMNSTYQIVYGRAASVKGPYTTKTGASFLNNSYTVLLTGDKAADGSVLHAGMGGQSFFWDHRGIGAIDTLFMDYHAYTAPSGTSYLNIKPVFADANGWLTVDPTQGTIITRTTSTSIQRTKVQGAQKSAFIGYSIHLVGNALGATKAPVGQLYSITGRLLNGNAQKILNNGIVIEKKGLP
jgi:arabinan endo-1,5-alpha-L-arabinosidase